MIAPKLRANLAAETWRQSGKEVPLKCNNNYYTLDAQNIQINENITFRYTKDHAKIARSRDITEPYVCIGDINRMVPYFLSKRLIITEPFVQSRQYFICRQHSMSVEEEANALSLSTYGKLST